MAKNGLILDWISDSGYDHHGTRLGILTWYHGVLGLAGKGYTGRGSSYQVGGRVRVCSCTLIIVLLFLFYT